MKLHIWKAANNQWYWNIKARNGRILADGGEGYVRRGSLIRTLHSLFRRIDAEEIHAQVHEQARAPRKK